MQYKKRRIPKNNKKEERRLKHQKSLIPLKICFPEVEQLVLDMRFANPEGVILQEDHEEYSVDDPVSLLIPCPGRCGDGKINLQAKIESLVRARAAAGEGRALCANTVYPSDAVCGCELKCQISLVYKTETAV